MGSPLSKAGASVGVLAAVRRNPNGARVLTLEAARAARAAKVTGDPRLWLRQLQRIRDGSPISLVFEGFPLRDAWVNTYPAGSHGTSSTNESPWARVVLNPSRMDLFASVAPMHGALDYHLERHSVLVANVSNVDTPGYVPKDLARVDFGGTLSNALSRTHEGHFAVGAGQVSSGMVITDPTAGGGLDQNKVSLDREAAKVAANQLRYDVISTLVTAELGGLSFAASDGRGG